MKGQTYPLIFLMMLIAFSAILARIAMPLVQTLLQEGASGSPVDVEQFVWWSIGVVGLGLLTGVAVGWSQQNIVVGLVVGPVLGVMVGALCLPFLAMPPFLTALGSLGWLFFCLVLLTVGTMMINPGHLRHTPQQRFVEPIDES